MSAELSSSTLSSSTTSEEKLLLPENDHHNEQNYHTNNTDVPPLPILRTEKKESIPSTVPLEWRQIKPKNGLIRFRDTATGEVHIAPPVGWSIRKTHQGKLFYIHHATDTSHWCLPPPGYDVGMTEDGKMYYIDNYHKRTLWHLPPPPSPGPLPTKAGAVKRTHLAPRKALQPVV